jgi:hemoglobin
MSIQSSHSASSRSIVRAEEVAMSETLSASITRRSVVAGLALAAAPVTVLASADNAHAQDKQTVPEKSLYERLGGVFAIAAVVDHFSDAVVKNPIVGQVQEPSAARMAHQEPGKAARPQIPCGRCGSVVFRVGPSSSRPPSPARRRWALKRPIRTSASPPQNLMRSQQNSDGPWTSSRSPSARRAKSWQGEVLAAFAAHKDEVTAGYVAAAKPR